MAVPQPEIRPGTSEPERGQRAGRVLRLESQQEPGAAAAGESLGQILEGWVVPDHEDRRHVVRQEPQDAEQAGGRRGVEAVLEPDLDVGREPAACGVKGLDRSPGGRAQHQVRSDAGLCEVLGHRGHGTLAPRREGSVDVGERRVRPAGLGVAKQPEPPCGESHWR